MMSLSPWLRLKFGGKMPGLEGFLVLNQNLQDFDRDNRFNSTSADLAMKFYYTFRF